MFESFQIAPKLQVTSAISIQSKLFTLKRKNKISKHICRKQRQLHITIGN